MCGVHPGMSALCPIADIRFYAFMRTRPKLHRLAIEFGAVPDISDFD